MGEAERIVVNTGPLITLAKAQAIPVIQALPFSFMCPQQVAQEIEAGIGEGHTEVTLEWLEVVQLRQPLNPVAAAALDVGEAAVIQLALEQEVERVCIDDKKGRRMALAVGLRPVGTLGLLLRAKNTGVISEVKPCLNRIMEAGAWYAPALIKRILREARE